MKRFGWLCISLLVLTFAAGCGTDHRARQVVEQNTAPGKLSMAMTGSGDKLVEAGRISLARNYDTPDGVTIDTWVIKADEPVVLGEGRPAGATVVILHGLAASKADFPFFGTAQKLAKMGYDVVLPDLRAHGRSTGKYVTFGASEKHDVKAIVDDLLRRGEIHSPIYAFGSSLGGATAIQYAAIDPRCKGIVAIEPFRDVASIAKRQQPLLLGFELQSVVEKAGEIAGFAPSEASSVAAAEKLTCPLLLVHGILGLSAPKAETQAIFEAAAGPKKIIDKPILQYALMEDWLAEQIDSLAKNGLDAEQE